MIVSLSRKKRKKDLRKKEKGENFSDEVGFRVYDIENMEEDGEEGQTWLKEIL